MVAKSIHGTYQKVITMCRSFMLRAFCLLIFTECIKTLRLLELHVPDHLLRGTRPQLLCKWKLGPTEELYSVKWYKDGKEFFRHVPTNQESLTKFKLPGVEVEESDSSGSNLTLSPVSLNSAGRYRCEVSGEKPLFPTVSNHADMEVIVLPDHGPIISGLHPRYKVGDSVEVKCISGRSHPPSQLGWYINGEPAPPTTVHPPTHHNDSQGHQITSLVLKFTITEKHFIDNRLKIKCLSTLFAYYWRSNEESVMKQQEHNYRKIELKHIQILTNKEPAIVQMRTSSNFAFRLSSMFTILHETVLCFAIKKIMHCLLH